MKDKDKERMLSMLEEALQALEKSLPDNVKVIRLSDVMNGNGVGGNTPTAIAKQSLEETEIEYIKRYALSGGKIKSAEDFLITEKDILKYAKASRIAVDLIHKWIYDTHEHKLSHKLRMLRKHYRKDRAEGYKMFENAAIGHVLMKFKADVVDSYELTPVSKGNKNER